MRSSSGGVDAELGGHQQSLQAKIGESWFDIELLLAGFHKDKKTIEWGALQHGDRKIFGFAVHFLQAV